VTNGKNTGDKQNSAKIFLRTLKSSENFGVSYH